MTSFMDRVRQARSLDIRDEARRLGIELANNGKGFYRPGGRGKKGKSPSGQFKIRDGVWRWVMHNGGEHGDVIDFVQYVTGCDAREALDLLLGDDRMPLPPVQYADPEPDVVVDIETRIAACTAFYEALRPLEDGPREWLEREKGISSATTSKFGLRQSDEKNADRAMAAAFQAVGVDATVALGLARPSKTSDSLRCPFGWGCWIAIPYRDFAGRILHLQFRRYSRSNDGDAKGPKYLHVNGEVPLPFNIRATSQPEYAVMLVEGALDAMVLDERGFPALGIPGTGWLGKPGKVEQVVSLTRDLVFAFDADEAGYKAKTWACPLLDEAADSLAEIVWPEGFEGDWCDLFAAPEPLQFEARPWKPPPPEGLLSWADVESQGVGDVLAEVRGEKERAGYRLGFRDIDDYVRLTHGSFTLIGARPSVGKTHVLLSAAYRMAEKYGTKVGVVSIEMSRVQLSERIAKAVLNLPRNLPTDREGLAAVSSKAELRHKSPKDLPVMIICPESKTEKSVFGAMTALVEAGVEVLLVDYAQDIAANGNNIEERNARASQLLKAFGKKTGVPVVAAAMLKRSENDKAAARRPRMAHIRGSGQYEQDADVVLLLHAPHQFDPDSPRNLRMVYIDKNRNGVCPDRPLEIEHAKPFGLFGDLSYRSDLDSAGRHERHRKMGL